MVRHRYDEARHNSLVLELIPVQVIQARPTRGRTFVLVRKREKWFVTIKHIPGKINTPADKLSCPPNSDQGENDNKDQTLLEPKLFINAAHVSQLPDSSKKNLIMLIHDHPTA